MHSGNFGQKSPKLSKMLFTRPALFELLFLMQTYSLKKSGMARTKISRLLLWFQRSYQSAQVRNQSSTDYKTNYVTSGIGKVVPHGRLWSS